jgi:hypothetical protein
MKKIIYTRPDGGISVVHPTEGARLALGVLLADDTVLTSETPVPVDRFLRRWPVAGATVEWAETEDEFVARIAKKDVPAEAINVQIVDDTVVPADRTFRDAWRQNGAAIEHDMEKCRAIHRQRIREARAPILAALDIEQLRGRDVLDRKQALRDAPADPRIAAASSVEQLKAVWPVALK